MRRLTWGLICFLACCHSQSQQLHELIDGATIKLAGTIRLERQGNNAYFVISPDRPYEAVFDSKDRRMVREIGLTMDGQWGSFRALIGQRVSVSGVVQLEPSSPYYFNGTLVLAKSLRLANGSELTPRAKAVGSLPAGLVKFYGLVTFSPRARERFTYKTWDSNARLLSVSRDYLACGLNGPGDVMNCYCPDGFVYTGKGTISDGHFLKTTDAEDGFSFAQFGIADPVRRFVKEAVECTREAHR